MGCPTCTARGDAESVRDHQAALDAGLTLLDTGDYYGMGHNQLLIRDALKGRQRDQVVISVKCGALRDATGNWLGIDGRPAAVKTFLAYTLRRLGTSGSTSIALDESIPPWPSRRPWAPWRRWSRPAS